MFTRSVMFAFGVLLFILTPDVTSIPTTREPSDGGDRTVEWIRTITSGNNVVSIKEKDVELKPGVLEMISDDPALHQVGFMRSASLHDFRKGILAIKIFDLRTKDGRNICVITVPLKTLGETMKELDKRRVEHVASQSSTSERWHVVSETVIEKTKSSVINEFCEGSVMFPARDAVKEERYRRRALSRKLFASEIQHERKVVRRQIKDPTGSTTECIWGPQHFLEI